MSDRKPMISFPGLLVAALLFSACSSVEATLVPLSPPVKLTPSVLPHPTKQVDPTSVPVSPSPTSSSSAAPVEALTDMGLFQYVDSVADLVSDPYGPAQLFAPEDGSLWILPLIRYEEQTAARWEPDDGQLILPISEEIQMSVDEAGRAWVIRKGGTEIEKWERGHWTVQGIDRGWTANSEYIDIWWAPRGWQVQMDAQGRIWLPTQRDVRVFDGGRWRIHTIEELGFAQPEWEELGAYHTIANLESSGQTWVGECHYGPLGPMGGNGVRWFDGNTWGGKESPVGEKCVSILTVDRSGDVWIGVADAIWRYQPVEDEWTSYPLPEAAQFGLNFNHPLELSVDRDGDVWVIVQLCGGANCDAESYLYRLHEGKGSVVAEPSDWWEPHKELFSGADGSNWLLWEGVFYQIEAGAMLPVASFNPRGMTLDPFGRVWVLVGEKEAAELWVLDVTQEQ